MIFGFGAAIAEPELQFVSRYKWREKAPDFGGFSGLELSQDGQRFLAIGDKGYFYEGHLMRRDGVLDDVRTTRVVPMTTPFGDRLRKYGLDSEGVAVNGAGPFFVSFEGIHRIWRYDALDGEGVWIPRPQEFKRLNANEGIEALAIDAGGRLFAIPENNGKRKDHNVAFIFDGQVWHSPVSFPKHKDFFPVGADFGPDGKLYVLERDFRGLLGFASLVRRFTVEGNQLTNPEILLQTRAGKHDNLEGISVWLGGGGRIRVTMISDDNFLPIQVTEFVEYVLIE